MNLTAITDAIAALVIAGLDIYDIDQIPDQADTRANAALFPEPVGFVRDLSVTPQAWGPEASRPQNIEYTLVYTLAYKPVGSGRITGDMYSGMVALAATIVEAFAEADFATSGGLLVKPSIPGAFGVVVDPAGNSYSGCQIHLRVLEFLN